MGGERRGRASRAAGFVNRTRASKLLFSDDYLPRLKPAPHADTVCARTNEASFPANSSPTRILPPSPTLFPSRRDATSPLSPSALPVNPLFDEGPSRMHAITGSSSAELHVSREREREGERETRNSLAFEAKQCAADRRSRTARFRHFSSFSLSLSLPPVS